MQKLALWLFLGAFMGLLANVVIDHFRQSETSVFDPLEKGLQANLRRIGWFIIVEIFSILIFGYCFWYFDFSPVPALIWACIWLSFSVLACIDWDSFLLPDILTLPLLFLGLLFAASGWNFAVTLQNSMLGASGSFVVLWLFQKGFYLLSGNQGLGGGDLKLFAALGAWIGFSPLLYVLFWAALIMLSYEVILYLVVLAAKKERYYFFMKESPLGAFLVLSAGLVWAEVLPLF